MNRTKPYIVNRNFFGLDIKLKQFKYLVQSKTTKIFSKQTSLSLDQYKNLFLEFINFKDGYFKVLEKNKNEQLCITPFSDYDEQYLVLFLSYTPTEHLAYFINVQDVSLRNNKHIIYILKNNSNFLLIDVEEENLKSVNISYDLKTRRENLVATYDVPGGSIPFYIHKTY